LFVWLQFDDFFVGFLLRALTKEYQETINL